MRRNPTSTPSLPQRLRLVVPLLFSLLFSSLFLDDLADAAARQRERIEDEGG